MRRVVWILAVLASHWRRHPMQLATLLIGLVSATALWSGVQALNQQARISYDRAAAVFGGVRTPMLMAQADGTFPQALFVKLRRAGWQVSPMLEGRVQIDGRSYRLLGIEPVTLPAEVGNAPVIDRTDFQAFVTPPGRTLVAPETLSDLGLAEGASRQRERRRRATAIAGATATRARCAGGRYRNRAAASEQTKSGVASSDWKGQGASRCAGERDR